MIIRVRVARISHCSRFRGRQVDTAMGDEHGVGGNEPLVGAIFRQIDPAWLNRWRVR